MAQDEMDVESARDAVKARHQQNDTTSGRSSKRGVMTPFALGDTVFRTKKDGTAFISQWLATPCSASPDVHVSDMPWVLSLLRRHPRWMEKADSQTCPEITVLPTTSTESMKVHNCFHTSPTASAWRPTR